MARRRRGRKGARPRGEGREASSRAGASGRKVVWPVLVALVIFLAFVLAEAWPARQRERELGANDNARVAALFEARQSDTWVTVEGVVERTLPDDTKGSRHQRFIVRLGPEQTVLVAHNIDLAPRAPVGEGTSVRLRGEYEWNEKGGVVHWTHHDPGGRKAGGWVEVDGQRYR